MKRNHFNTTVKIIAVFSLMIIVLGTNTLFSNKMNQKSNNSDFLTKVQYIISKDEEKFYKNLPEEKQEEFIQQFWDIRDPDPDTPENEFKEEYFNRIDDANKQFTAAREGWLTDRGKAYILLGPPNYVENYPMGGNPINNFSRNPYSVWHYIDFYLIFVDNRNDGDYQIQYTDLGNIADVQEAFQKAKMGLKYLDKKLGYNFELKRNKQKSNILVFSIETESITFASDGDNMVAEFQIQFKLKNKSFDDIWSYSNSHSIHFAKSDIHVPKKITLEIPLGKEIPKGSYFCFTSLKRSDEKEKMFLNKMIKVK